jgi:hypothetical protein
MLTTSQSAIETNKQEEIRSEVDKLYGDLKIINSNGSSYFKNQIDELYASMDASSKGEFDPVTYLTEQDTAVSKQESLFNELKSFEATLVNKYTSLLNNLGRSDRDTDYSIMADNIRRDIENAKLEFGKLRAVIVNKSVILPNTNSIKELEKLFEFTEKQMSIALDKSAYIFDLYEYGYSLVNIFQKISHDFHEKASNTTYEKYSDVLNKNAEHYHDVAQAWMIKTDKAALPGLFQRMGRETTPSGDLTSTVSLSGAVLNMKRFAKDDSKNAKNEYTEYWDSLMMQSLDPVELGTIIYEKPKHGDKTIKEEQKLHGTKFKKNMMKKSKPRFKKDK